MALDIPILHEGQRGSALLKKGQYHEERVVLLNFSREQLKEFKNKKIAI